MENKDYTVIKKIFIIFVSMIFAVIMFFVLKEMTSDMRNNFQSGQAKSMFESK